MKHLVKLLLSTSEINELRGVCYDFLDAYSGSGENEAACKVVSKLLEVL